MLRRFGALFCVTIFGLSACSASNEVENQTTLPEVSYWLPCGDIECAEVAVPVDYSQPDGPQMNLAVYRRLGSKTDATKQILLVPDRSYFDDAKALIEKALANLGSDWTAQTLISIAPRGSVASPMPQGFEHMVATRDVARDLEQVRQFLDLGDLRAIGWGTGANALSVLSIQNPDAISRVVLDSPIDSLMPANDRVAIQIATDNDIVAEALRWCVSHISCPMHLNVARELNLFRTNVRIGIVDPQVTPVVLARAARNAFAIADPQSFFNGVVAATNGDSGPILATSGEVADIGEVYAVCADETSSDAQFIAQQLGTNQQDVERFFSIGDDHVVYDQCATIATSLQPLNAIEPSPKAKDVAALVMVAENNPVVSAQLSNSLANRFSWETYSVPLWRHLVVGYDQDSTKRAIDFLAS